MAIPLSSRGMHALPADERPVKRLGRFLRSAIGSISIPVPDPLRRLAQIPLTTLGLACMDGAAFAGNLIAGLAVTGISLIVLEFLIADSE